MHLAVQRVICVSVGKLVVEKLREFTFRQLDSIIAGGRIFEVDDGDLFSEYFWLKVVLEF